MSELFTKDPQLAAWALSEGASSGTGTTQAGHRAEVTGSRRSPRRMVISDYSSPSSGQALEPGGGGGNDGGMEARVDRLDRAVERIDADLTSIKTDVAVIKERLSHVPTKAQLLGYGCVGAIAIIGALWKIVSVLLEANNANLAAQIVKSIPH